MANVINLNADMGEGFGAYDIGDDAGLLKVIRSASIACGFHAGDPVTMQRLVTQAVAEGVSIGAHPGFNDLWGFGRRRIDMNPRELEYMIAYQIGALQAMACYASAKVTHLKPHGALNNMAAEDIGLAPDRDPGGHVALQFDRVEPSYSRREAIGTAGFWLLLLYTVLVYPVQAGVSLHQAAHLIERGIAPTIAATIVSAFSLASAVASMTCGFLPRSLPIRYPLALIGVFLAVGALWMTAISTAADGYGAAALFGCGIGGLLTSLPLAWADYFGRAHFAAIRSVALSAHVLVPELVIKPTAQLYI